MTTPAATPTITPVATAIKPLDIPLKVREALTDPEIIWEGMSSDGVKYPFDDYLPLGSTREERQDMAIRRREYDDILAINIGDLVISGDHAELGRIVAEQLITHAERVWMEME